MSFAAPAFLLGLLAVPVAIVWYLRQEAGRRQGATAFAGAWATASVAPHRPGVRRHLPMVCFALALIVLVGAAARPRITVTATVGHSWIMLLTDESASMAATDIAPNRATAAQRAADVFVGRVPGAVSIGVIAFNQSPLLLQEPTRDRVAAYQALGRLRIGGGTASGTAIETADAILRRNPARTGGRPVNAIVLLSDGKSTSGVDPVVAARASKRIGAPVYTVAIGTPRGTISHPRPGGGSVTESVPPDPPSLAQIAAASGGRAYTAQDATRLSDVYRSLAARLTHQTERHEITVILSLVGLALMALGSALSLAWFGRLI